MARWFRNIRKEFVPLAREFAGRPIMYVEIGCWEGDSARWVAENVLTHPDSHGFGIDPWEPLRRGGGRVAHSSTEMDERYHAAREKLEAFPRWQWIRGRSQDVLRDWRVPIDLLYIDGVHEAPYVLQDFVLAWKFLTVGAIVIFDDYGKGKRREWAHVPEAIEAIKIAFAGLVEPCEGIKVKQYSLRVLRKACDREWFHEQIGAA